MNNEKVVFKLGELTQAVKELNSSVKVLFTKVDGMDKVIGKNETETVRFSTKQGMAVGIISIIVSSVGTALAEYFIRR